MPSISVLLIFILMHSVRASSYLRSHFWPLLLITAVVLWSGWSVVSHIYGYNDDYHLLLRARRGDLDWFRNEFSEGGRYLLSPLMVFAYKSVQDVSMLVWMRGFGLLGTVLLSISAYVIVFRDLGKQFPAFCAAILISLNPATATWLGWAACFAFPFIATIALASGRWAWSALRKPWRWQTMGPLAGNVAILIMCFSFYQPNGPFWIIGFWIGYWFEPARANSETLVIDSRESTFRAAWRLSAGPLILILAGALYFVLFRFIADTMDLQGQSKRGAVSLMDLPERLLWLCKAYTPRVFAHWTGLVSPLAAQMGAIVAGVLAALAVLFHRRTLRVRTVIQDSAITTTFLALSLLPMLAASDHMIAFRVMGPPLALVGILLVESIRVTAERLKSGQAAQWILPVLVLSNIVLFKTNLNHGFVDPGSREFEALTDQIAERIDEFPSTVIYRFPPEKTAATHFFKPTAEFGPYSSYQKWVIPSFLQLILEERFGRDQPRVVVRTLADPDAESEAPVISALEAITGPPIEHKIDPYWGPIDVHKQGWIYSEWFGVLKNDKFPEIKHAEHHYLRCNPREEGDEAYWFLDWQTKRWFYTTAKTYPKVFFPDTNQTAMYKPIVRPLRSFRDQEHGEWIVFF